MSPRVILRCAILGLSVAALAACSGEPEDISGASENKLSEGEDIPTPLTELRAGEPFAPGLNQRLLQVGEACLGGTELEITGGTVKSEAKVVQSRTDLDVTLGLTASAVSIPGTPISAGASLSLHTTFDRQSAVIVMYSGGTYKSSLKKVETLPTFSPSEISRCGYGYIAEAQHRVGVGLVVTVRSTDLSITAKADLNADVLGIGNFKQNLAAVINKGNVEISVRIASDPIPNLPSAPLGDMVIVVGNGDAEKQQAIEKINRSLDWLGQVQTSIEKYMLDLKSGAAEGLAAPTQSVRFYYYPSTPIAVRRALETASQNAVELRARLAEAGPLLETWSQFANDEKNGTAYAWNIPGAPVDTVEQLDAKKRQLLEGGESLASYSGNGKTALRDCVEAIRNDVGETDIAASLTRACRATPLPFDPRASDLRPIERISVTETAVDEPCPEGYRKPIHTEAQLFGPWSRWAAANRKMGIWLEELTYQSGWLYDGKIEFFANPVKGLRVCVSRAKGAIPQD